LIIAEKALPRFDLLSFTSDIFTRSPSDLLRGAFILKQYWLGQLAMYASWQLAGDAGIVIMRAICYTAILTGILFWMRTFVSGIYPLVFTILTGVLLRDIPNERPQLFSFLFFALTLYLLDRLFSDNCRSKSVIIALLCTMLAWSNTHGAYILGVGLCSIFLISHFIQTMLRHTAFDWIAVATISGAVSVTLINPNSPRELLAYLSMPPSSITNNFEYMTPFTAITNHHYWFAAYWIYLASTFCVIVIFRKRFPLQHILTLFALILLSFTALRYMIFPLLASSLVVRHLPEISLDRSSAIILTSVFALWIFLTWDKNVLKFSPQSSFPIQAAEFISSTKPVPQLFNYYDWGGYLSLSVPGIKVFIDGRGLSEKVSSLHDQIMHGENSEYLLNSFGINTVVVPSLNPLTGMYYQLIERLSASPAWFLVYYDSSALVYCRNVPGNNAIINRFGINKQEAKLQIIKAADRMNAENPKRELVWLAKANALQLLGRHAEARESFEKVLNLNPDNAWARRMTMIRVR
jgi:hypothetical protein